MGAAGMVVEDSKGECNFGQHEINFRYADALRTADEHAIYKNGAKEIAAAEGVSITLHGQVRRARGQLVPHPLLARGRRRARCSSATSALFESFLAGQLACLRELTLLLAPNINSYKRYAAGSFAPTAVAWGHDNRTCSLRVVGHGPSRRFENRVGGADLNPYLALSAIIASGLHGVRERPRARAAARGQRLHRDGDHPRVPDTLREARELFAASAIARDAFGEEVVDALRQRRRRRAGRLRLARSPTGSASGGSSDCDN